MQDGRFDSKNDPRFKPLFIRENKIKVDKRFSRILTDEDFSVISSKDPFGNNIKKKKDRDISLIYEENSCGDIDQRTSLEKEITTAIDSSESEGSFEWDDESIAGLSREEANKSTQHIRNLNTESIWENNPLKHVGISEGDATSRLAIMGLDWDNINADDIYVILSSFLSGSGITQAGYSSHMLKKVTIYPSNFGKERMEYEEINGPKIGDERMLNNIIENTSFSDEVTNEDYEAIRKYQVEKSLYYYAIVECDSVDTAIKLYDELDGMEADFSIDSVDIRFVPDNIVDFPYEAKSISMGIPIKYKQPECFTSALRHSRPTLTWDDTPKERVKFFRKKFTKEELSKIDFDAYLGSSDSELEVDYSENSHNQLNGLVDSKLSNVRDILLGDAKDIFDNEIEKNENNGIELKSDKISNNDIDLLFRGNECDYNNVEVEFNQDLENLSMDLIAKGKQKWEDQTNNENEHDKPLTPWQKYLNKKKQKRKERRIKLRERIREQKLQRNKSTDIKYFDTVHNEDNRDNSKNYDEQSDDEDKHFDMRKIALTEKFDKVKAKKRKEFILNATSESIQKGFVGSINDPRISKIFTDADFAIDPTNPTYKPTEFNKMLLFEKRSQKIRRNKSENMSKSKVENNCNDIIEDEALFELLSTKNKKKKKKHVI